VSATGNLDVGVLMMLLGALTWVIAFMVAKSTPVRSSATITLARHGPVEPFLTLEHAGAVLGWSPATEVDRAEAGRDRIADLAAAERAELADARAELAPLLAAEQRAITTALLAFSDALQVPMEVARRWHEAGADDCTRCRHRNGEVFGQLGDDREHTGIRAFRIDTPTGSFPIVETA
jgi:hypothetical protein